MSKHIQSPRIFLMVFLVFATNLFAKDSEFFTHENPLKTSSDVVEYLAEDSGVSILNFTGNFDKSINGTLNVEARKAVTEELYQHIPDQYDFLVFFTQFPVDSDDSSAFAISYQNDVQGIGMPVFNNSLAMGSEKLQSTIDMTELSDWELNPGNRLFDSTLDIMIHEMLHRWGIHINFLDHNNQASDLLRGRDDNHWSYFADSNASVMYGANWEEVSPGLFETKAISQSLSPLDLYLMGFNEATSVPDFFIINEGVPGNRIDTPSPIGTQVSGNRINISVNDIIAAEGQRIPSVTDAQHKFKFKFVLLKSPSQEVSQTDIGSLVVLQREFQKRFFAETDGLGEIVYPIINGFSETGNPNTLLYDILTNSEVDLNTAEIFLMDSFDSIHNYWSDKSSTRVRDTAMAVNAMRGLNQIQYVDDGGLWINSYVGRNNDDLAWLLLSNTLSQINKNLISNQLLNSVNSDGGWGLNQVSESSAYDTALVLKALNESGEGGYVPSSSTLLFVLNQINDDGGIGFSTGGKSSLTSSALMLSTFYEMTGNAEMEQSLIDFVIDQQHPDGGFGEVQVTAHETAVVIQGLRNAFNQGHFQIIVDAKAKLSTMQSFDGSFEGSIYATALAVQVLFNEQLPNLSINSVYLLSDQAVSGEQVAVEFTLVHSGLNDLNDVNVSLLIDQQVIQVDVIPNLIPNDTFTGNFILDTSSLSGLVSLNLVVDPNYAIAESNESDNSQQIDLNIQPQSSSPELAINLSTLVYQPEYFDALPFEFTADFAVSNLSATNLNNVKVSLLKVVDENNQIEVTSEIQSINAGQSQLFSFNSTITEALGDLELVLKVDPDNQILEVNEDNNELKVWLNTISTIDLELIESQINLPSQFILGQQAVMSFEFNNLGTHYSPGFNVQVIYHGSDEPVILYENFINEMLGGQSLERQLSWTPAELGEFNLEFLLDESNAVAEVNEGNNSITIPVSVVGNAATNLQIEDASISITPEPGLTGQTLEITALVKNTSNSESGSFDLNFYQQQTNQASVLITSIPQNASIPAGGESLVITQINSYSHYGDVTFIAQVDPNNTITEFNENDNIGFNTFRILNKPDAMVSSGGFSLTPSVPVLGNPLSVEVVIVNLGEQDLLNLEVKLYTQSNNLLVEVGTAYVPSVVAGQNEAMVFNFSFPNDPDVTGLLVKVDTNDDINEINENNNQAILSIENQNSELYVTEKFISPNGDGVKDETQIVFNLDEDDDYQISILDEFNQVIREFPLLPNTSFGDVIWDGRDDQQQIARDSEYRVEIIGLNSLESKHTTVILDTNRTTLLEAINLSQGTFFDLGCSLNDITGYAVFSTDGKYLFTNRITDKQGVSKTGLFRIKTDGSEIDSLLPTNFVNNHSIYYWSPLYVMNSGEIVVFVTSQNTGDSELWKINPSTKSLQQLDTQITDDFSIKLVTDQFTLIEDSNSGNQYYKVFHSGGAVTEHMPFDLNGDSLNSVYKLDHGWFWTTSFQDEDDYYSDYYYDSSETLTNTQLILNDSAGAQFSVSEDGKYLSVYSYGDSLYRYYQVGENQLYPVINNTFNSQVAEVFSRILRKNDLLQLLESELRIYNKEGVNIVISSHPFNLDYFKQQLIDRFGSLDTLVFSSKASYVEYSFDQIDDLQLKFVDIKVNEAGPNEVYIGFSAYIFGRVAIPADGLSYFKTNFYSNDRIEMKINFSQLENIEIKQLKNIQVITPKLYEGLSPYFSMGNAIYYKTIDQDERRDSHGFWDHFQIKAKSSRNWRPSVVKKVRVTSSTLPDIISCTSPGDTFNGIFQPKANLTAFLNARVQSNGVELTGSAFDQNFDNYLLQWKALNQNNSSWQTLKVSASAVHGEFLMYWTPTIVGHYQIRLTAYDQAGNHVSDTDEVYIGNANQAIRSPSVYPEHFSPNGDGVQDELTIEYEVVQTTDVAISIENSSGQVVRTFVREYATGQLDSVIWDGLGEQSQVLPDDYYTISFNNFSFQVVLDVTPPDVFFRMKKNQEGVSYTWPAYPWSNGMGTYSFVEDNFTDENNLRSGFNTEFYDEDNQFWIQKSRFCNISPVEPFDYDIYQDEKYRCYTSDLAGNQSNYSELTVNIDPIYSRQLLKRPSGQPLVFSYTAFECAKDYGVSKVMPPCNDDFFINQTDHIEVADWSIEGELFFALEPFSNKEIIQIKLTTSYIPVNAVDPNPEPITSERFLDFADNELLADELLFTDEKLFRFNTNASGMFGGQSGSSAIFYSYYLHLKKEYFPETEAVITNTFEFLYEDGETHHVELKISFAFGAVEKFVNADDIFTRGVDYFWHYIQQITNSNEAHIKAGLDQIFENVDYDFNKNYWLFIKSVSEDISNPVVIEKQVDRDQIEHQSIFSIHHLPDGDDVGFEIQLFETDRYGCQVPAISYLGLREDGTLIEIEAGSGFILLFCLDELQIKQSFLADAQCNEFAQVDDLIRIEIDGLIGENSSDPASLEIYRLVEGVEDVLFVDTDLTVIVGDDGKRTYQSTVEFDKNNFAVGRQFIFVRFKDIEGNEFEKVAEFLVQNQKVNTSIIQPNDQQIFCAVGREDGIIPVPVQLVFDNNGPKSLNAYQYINGVFQSELMGLTSRQKAQYEALNDTNILFVEGQIFSEELELNTPSFQGESTLVFDVINSAGVSQCESVVVEVDSLIEMDMNFPQSINYLSPTGTGYLSTIEFAQITAHEALQVIVDVISLESNQSMGTLYDFHLGFQEQTDLIWNGEVAGQLLEDGEYSLAIKLIDSCGIQRTDYVGVIIDTTLPQISFTQPIDNQVVAPIIEILASIVDLNLDTASLELSYLYNGVWSSIQIESLTEDIIGDFTVLSTWNLSQLPAGDYPLKLYVVDLAGNEFEYSIQVNRDEQLNLVWDYRLSQRYFSPNDDQLKDETTLNLGLNLNSQVSIQVVDSNQILINQLLNNETLTPGNHAIIWNGLDTYGQVVVDGDYEIITTVSEVGTPSNSGTLTLGVVVDNTVPASSFIPTSAVIKGENNLLLNVTETNLSLTQVWLQKMEPLESELLLLETSSAGQVSVVSLDELVETSYQARTVVSDLAGNQLTFIHPFKIDNTAPVINMVEPINESFIGGDNSQLNFSGEITDANFSQYQLYISPNVEPEVWDLVLSGSELLDNEFINEWPIPDSDGVYLLKALAIDQAGWETESLLEVTIDSTSPTVSLTNPLLNSSQGQSIDITGTINDQNIDYFNIKYKHKDESDTQWKLIHSGIDNQFDTQLLLWDHDLLSGTYELRITAVDKVQLVTETTLEFSIDSEPPLAPLYLEAELINQQDVHLNWVSSPSIDVVGYWIYRNNVVLNQSLVTQTTYQDLAVSESEFTYWVVAVDDIGNVSLPSNSKTILVDRTGPDTFLYSPEQGQLISGVIDVVGTANSADDFFGYQLFYRESGTPEPGIMLAQSSLPVMGEKLAELDTTNLTQGMTYVLRLEATDLIQNLSFVEHIISIDNVPPVAPINLTHQLTGGNDVQLIWNANSESDLAGYLIYRNGVIISGNGSIQSSIITATTFSDVDAVDGVHIYYVIAVDQAGNISTASNTVQLTIDTRPPHAYFTAPIEGHKFESTIRLEATADDVDLVSVLFEFSTDNLNWHQLLTDLEAPYDALFSPADYTLSYGTVYFRVTATDVGAQTDLNPDQISVEYTDLTPPDAVVGLVGLVSGHDIQLNWDDNSETDLLGYVVYRKRVEPNPQEVFIELTDPAVVDNQFLDDGLAVGTYLYRVLAIDSFDNPSENTDSSELTVFSILLEQPYSPLITPASIEVNGSSAYYDDILAELDNESGVLALNSAVVNPQGQFVLENILLDVGDNQINAHQQTIEGHTSIESSVSVQLSPVPLKPANPVAEINDFDLDFTWEAPEITTLGYLPYINQQPVFTENQLTENLYPYASSYSSGASSVFDGDINTTWSPSYWDMTNGTPTYIQAYFQGSRWVTKVNIHWEIDNDGDAYQPSQYLLQFRSPVGWITQIDYSGNVNADVSFTANVPYWTEGIRVLIPVANNTYENISLSEIEIWYQPIITQLNYSPTLTDGTYDIQVSAINAYGFESDLSPIQNFVVGDVVPPETVVLNAQIENGNQVLLNWTASSSVDVTSYHLFKAGNLLMMTGDNLTLSYLDVDLPNGSHNYQVRAVDHAGNLSEYSNEVMVEISQQLLDPPTGLSITAIQTGQALNLNWNEVISPDFSHYLVYRSTTSGSVFDYLNQEATNSYIDTGLSNGNSYYYYLTAVDQFGNESLPSEVVSGIPVDLIVPDKPIISKPTENGIPIETNDLNINVSGYGSPAVEVDLYHGNQLIDTVASTHQFTAVEIENNGSFDGIRFNNNGCFAAYSWNDGEYVIVHPESATTVVVNGLDIQHFFWHSSGTKLYVISGYGTQSELKSYGLDGQEIATLFSGFDIRTADISIDESQMFYWGDGVNPDTSNTEDGLWIYHFFDGTYQKIDVGPNFELSHDAIKWLTNGDLAFINFPNGLSSEGVLWIQKSHAGTLNILEANTARESILSSSLDGSHLYYTVIADSNKAIARQRLSDGSLKIYAKEGIDVFMPVVNEDIDLVFVNVDCCEKELVNLESGQVSENFQNFGYELRVSWLHDGRIMYFDNNRVFFFIPPGIFEFENIALTPGINQFFVVARKTNGLSSLPSEPIVVSLRNEALPDLEIKPAYLQILPTEILLGRSATASVLVKNNSQVGASNARLLIELIYPDLQVVTLHPSPLDINLAANENFVQNFSLPDLNVIGEYALKVHIDSNQQVLESNEQNNVVMKIIQVIDDTVPDLSLSLSSPVVFPGGNLQGEIRVYNPGTDFIGAVLLKVMDVNGFPVGHEELFELPQLDNGSVWQQVFIWNSANLFAGDYLVEVTLYGQNQQSVEVKIESFVISEVASFDISLTSNAPQIPVNQTVNLTANIDFYAGNVSQAN